MLIKITKSTTVLPKELVKRKKETFNGKVVYDKIDNSKEKKDGAPG